jgi:hypothetical protein
LFFRNDSHEKLKLSASVESIASLPSGGWLGLRNQ